MNTNIWETELLNELKEEITNYLKNINENKTYLLDVSKNEFCLIEKYIYDICCFHFKMLGLDINKNYIVFELKNTIDFSDLNNIKIDVKNKFLIENKENKYCDLLLSCESYFNKKCNYPTIITDIDLENYKYKEFDKKNKLQFIFPQDNKHITFDGSSFHGVLKINELGQQKDNNYLAITINLLGDKPNNITYFSNNENNDNDNENNNYNHTNIYFKEPSIINIKDNNTNLKTIYKKERIFDYNFYENIFYNNKGKIELPSIVIQEINNNNFSVYNYIFIDNYDENAVDLVKNKQIELINKQIVTMRKIDCNKDNVNNCLLSNRFIQRFTYKNIFSKNVCEWIINQSESYANTNNGWNRKKNETNETNKITQYLQADKLKSIFGFILFSFNDIFNKVKKSYCLTENITFNINNIFIIKNEKNMTNSIKEPPQNNFFTMYILLSDPLVFKGGGYYFDDGITEYLNQGDLIVHSNKVKNSELEIYDGKKYVLVAHIDLSI
jgi:hypothetical protein